MKKKLTKSNTNVVLTGTLGGIAEYFNIDPTIVRIIYVVLSIWMNGFPGVLLYIALSVIIPRTAKRERRQFYGQQSQQPPRKEAERVDDNWDDF